MENVSNHKNFSKLLSTYCISSKRAPITVIWADSVFLIRSLDETSRATSPGTRVE